MRVLVTGAGGQVGRELLEAFDGTAYEVVGFEHGRLDVGDRDQVLQVIGQVRPDTVVHAGAWTDVDGCEADPDRAYRDNALGTRYVAEAARLFAARLVYVSTDYVFDGTLDRPYTEWDRPNPLSVYGRSKLGGEAELGPEDTLVRTAWVCGRYGRNFVRTVLSRAGAGQPLKVVDDQHGCPTFADDLAAAIARLVVARRPGTFHVTNQGRLSWYEFAVEIVKAAGLDPALVTPITTEQLDPPRLAPRPRNSVLDNTALRLGNLPLLPEYGESLARLVKDLE